LFYDPPKKSLEYRQLIETALQEDLDERGDVTSQAVDDRPCQALFLSKDRGLLAAERTALIFYPFSQE
jgi:nicotinate-nucleotide pyrophosphorylase